MTANYIYTIAGTGDSGYSGDGGAATVGKMSYPEDVSVDVGGNVYIADAGSDRIRFIPKISGTYFGASRTANFIYTIGGTGSTPYNGENAVATGKNINTPTGLFVGADNIVYVADSNNKIRMIAGEDFIAPSTSTLAGIVGSGEVTLNWDSAGDNMNVGNLTGNYRIQYATYTASWSTASTPTHGTTVTISTTNVVPGSAQNTVITGLGGTNVYFVLWSQDDAGGWSGISNTLWVAMESVAPSTSTLAAESVSEGVVVSWASAGDDGMTGTLTGSYRIQYATYTATWSTSTTPTNATTVSVATTSVTPGSPQSFLVSSGLTGGATEYFVLWTQDDASNWSGISNTTSAVVTVDTVPPAVTSLNAVTGTSAGAINLSWSSAGDDGNSGALSGNYRIQYATYTATWSTSTTPTGAYTSTVTASGVAPGTARSTIITVSPTTVQTWYFVLWTQDEAGNWSTISSAVSASPPGTSPVFGMVVNPGVGLSLGGTAWGDYDNDGDLDVVVSGTDGTNSQVRVYKSNGDGTYNSTAVNVAAANSGLKAGDVAFGDYDNDGDLDVLASGTDGTNLQLRVYKNNGDGTFNTTGGDVPGSANIGLSSGTVAWGDFDNDGDLDVLANGSDGSNNQLRVFKNKGDGTFDSTAINVAGLNSGLKQGSVAWGDFDNDGDLDVLVSGTDGTNRQLRVYKNNGDGTFNSTAINVAGSANIGLSDGRAVWGDFNKDGYLDVVVSGTNGTNSQLRVYANIGNGTFNSTPVNLAGSNLGVTFSAVALGDYNVDGNLDVLAAGRPAGLVGYWKFDENSGTSAADLSGQGNTGTFYNSPTWVTGTYGSGVNFGGGTAYVRSNLSKATMGSTPSLSFWIKPTGAQSTKGIMQVANSLGDGVPWILLQRKNSTTISWYFNDDYRIDETVNDNTWYHLAVVYDGSTWRAYKNGVADGTYTGPVGTNNGTYTWFGNGYNGYFNGVVDDVRIYNRPLSAGEVLGLYQATKSSIGTLRIYSGGGDGTFNGTPVEVDAGLEKGQVAWGDADGDGDLDILTAGTDGLTSLVQVYLSTQSLTATNTAPSAPGTLAAAFSFSVGTVSVASFTWTAGSDSGTGSSGENALSYDIRISTKSDFVPLVAPGEEGASPRLGAYLRPPKVFSGNTAYGVMLTSTNPWTTQSTAGYGLRTDTTYYYQVKTVDAGLATSAWSAGATLNTGVAPSTSTIAASTTAVPGEVALSWVSAGDDGMIGNLTGTYRIQYATYTASWDTHSTPTNGTTVTVATTSVSPGEAQAKGVTGLTGGATYYFVLWSQDDANNWSGISNTTWTYLLGDVTAPSTSTLAATAGLDSVTLSWNSAGDDGMIGDLTGHYRIQYATYTVSWTTDSTPPDATTVTIATTSVTPGSAQENLITGLTGGTTYYFVLWSQDEVDNWSEISNTTSTIPIIPVRSVTITYGNSQAFGSMMMGSIAVGSTGTVVLNDGNLENTYVLRGSTQTAGTPWSLLTSTPTGPNQLVIFGVFSDATAPVEVDFGPEDVIGPTNQTSSGTAYTVNGSTTGTSVPAEQNRTLWIRLDMPTRTTTVQEQSMKVEITAQPP
jgi:hypothetical protein